MFTGTTNASPSLAHLIRKVKVLLEMKNESINTPGRSLAKKAAVALPLGQKTRNKKQWTYFYSELLPLFMLRVGSDDLNSELT